MSIKNRVRILTIIVGIFLLLFLVGCKSAGTDEAQITQIAENIEEAIEEKDVDLFMENISYNYSDTDGGTYDNHINNLPEEIFSNIEENEDLVDGIFSIFKIEQEVTIPESDIIVTDIYASGKMEIKIILKACIAWVICTDLYNETTNYDVDFIKEDDDWKIISMKEI
jgi:galactitol-specific phosphotransferase system IIB component